MFIFGFKFCSQKDRRLIKRCVLQIWFIAIFWLNLRNDDYHHFFSTSSYGRRYSPLWATNNKAFFPQICEVGGLAIIQKMGLAKFG
jgi:hypothetical protein